MVEVTGVSEQRLFGGRQMRFTHESQTLQCRMQFSVYLPPQAEQRKIPVVYWLSGLTCNDENFSTKAGAQRIAAQLGLALVMPDTSPRGESVPDDPEGAYDFGHGAGFYVNATKSPYNTHYHMYDYIVKELPALVENTLPVSDLRSICGHSMGGHGALVIALREQGRYCSASAFAPIANPTHCPWGRKAFTGYLGSDENDWRQYDASLLLASSKSRLPLLVDQGSADQFLQQQLHPETLVNAAKSSDSVLNFRMQAGYDHSYYFIATFIEDHLRFHAQYF